MNHLDDALRHLGQAIEALYEHGEEQGESLELSQCRNRVNRAIQGTAELALNSKDNHAEQDRNELPRPVPGPRGAEADPA